MIHQSRRDPSIAEVGDATNLLLIFRSTMNSASIYLYIYLNY